MSLLDELFGAPAAAAAPQTVQLVQAPPATPAEPEPQGLDKFQDIWKMPDGYKAPESFDPTKLHQMDPAAFQAEVAKLDFTQGIDPTAIQAIASGGEEAVKALGTIIRQATQNVYANSTMTTTKLIENALSKSAPAVDQKIAAQLRGHEVSRALSESNPLFTNPATAQLLEPLKNQLMAKHPNATPQELAGMAKEFLISLAGGAAPQTTQTTPNGAAKETDWEKYFEQPTQLRG